MNGRIETRGGGCADGPRPSFRTAVLVLAALANLGFGASSALAQAATGPFLAPAEWWVGPSNSLGVNKDGTGTMILVDVDGDGSVTGPADHAHPYPAELASGLVSNQTMLRLSPERDVLYAFGEPTIPCPGSEPDAVKIYLYRIPAADGANLFPLVTGECFALGVSQQGFMQSPLAVGNDVFYVAEQASPTTLEQRLFWVDLNTGATATTFPTLEQSIGAVTFDPNVFVALVPTDVDATSGVTYYLVELCEGNLGQTYSTTGSPLIQVTGSPLVGSLVSGSGGVDILLEQDAAAFYQTPLADCLITPPVTGACCLPDGSCADGVTQAACEGATNGGTWQGAGTQCAGTNCPQPPAPSLVLSGSGPGSGTVLVPLTYTFAWSNQGTGPAHNVVLTITIPVGPGLDSYTPGGVWNPSFRRLQYSLGDVADGSSGSVDVTLVSACGTASYAISSYYMTSTEQAFVFGSPTLPTLIQQPGSSPIGFSVTSVADAGEPVLNGETITHTFVLDNLAGAANPEVHFLFTYGSQQELDAVLDAGGGSFVTQNGLTTWTGGVPAFSQVQLAVRTRISPCRPPTVTSTTLNNGGALVLRNTCNAVLGTTATPTTISLGAVPLTSSLTIENLPQPMGSGFGGAVNGYLVRDGDRLEARMVLQNQYSSPAAGVVASVTFPPGILPDGDPPFLAPVPPGAAWDAGTGTISWSGTLPAQGSVEILWAMNVTAGLVCSGSLPVRTSLGTCTATTSSQVALIALAAPYPAPHLLALDEFSGVNRARPGVDNATKPWLCGMWEIANGMGEGASGDLWIVGLPAIRLNPYSRELEIQGSDFFSRLDMVAMYDVAVDTTADVVYFSGTTYLGFPPLEHLRVRAWDRGSDTVTPLFDDPATPNPTYGRPTRMFLDRDGQLAVTVGGGVLRIDPGNPGSTTFLQPAGFPFGVSAATQAHNGSNDYYMVPYIFDTTSPAPLLSYDPASGATVEMVPDLRTFLPPNPPSIVAAETGPWGDLFLQEQFRAFVDHFQLAPPLGRTVIGNPVNNPADLEWYGRLNSVPVPEDKPDLPRQVAVRSIEPNPFNPRTTVVFDLPREGHARVSVHDLRGRLVRVLRDGRESAGSHRAVWDGNDARGRSVASGVYFVKVAALGVTEVRKMALLR